MCRRSGDLGHWRSSADGFCTLRCRGGPATKPEPQSGVVKQSYGLGSELGFVCNVITVSGFTAVGLQSVQERRFFKHVMLLPRVYLCRGSTEAAKECLTGKPVCLVFNGHIRAPSGVTLPKVPL